MASTFRYHGLLERGAVAAVAVSILCVAGVVCTSFFMPSVESGGLPGNSGVARPEWPTVAKIDEVGWRSFRGMDRGTPVPERSLASRFRLAGTFFVDDPGGTNVVKAILDELGTEEQHILAPGSRLGTVEVVSIHPGRIVLREYDNEEELWLGEAGSSLSPSLRPTFDGLDPALLGDERAISTNRFGWQIGENRWVLSRDVVMAYCREVADHPARYASVFDSMDPVWGPRGPDGRRTITDYVVDIVGEEELFLAAGLQNGDRVLAVNTVRMTNKELAFDRIDEFLNEEVNSFVLEIERDGRTMQMQYLFR